MESIITGIARLATTCTFDDLPSTTVNVARDRIVDSIGCALGANDAAPVRAAFASAAADAIAPGGGAWTIGSDRAHTHAFATFVNTTMLRYLDFNDWAPYGHPSDCVGALLAFSEADGVDGRGLVTATAVAYEVFMGLTDAAKLVQNGWDQGYSVGLSVIAGLGNLLRLDPDVVAHALSIFACSGIAFGVVRLGDVSAWKACATAFGAQNAVSALDFARAGIDGPPNPFSGRDGVFEAVTGPFDLTFPLTSGEPGRIERTSLKFWPGCYHLQAPLWAALELHEEVALDSIASIDVYTYQQAHKVTASDDGKWHPMTRETADHSLPYAVARALRDGRFSNDAYDESAFREPDIVDLMQKVCVYVDDGLTHEFPEHVRVRVDVTDRQGGRRTRALVGPAGHPDNPMTPTQLRDKFRRLATTPLSGDEHADAAFDAWRRLTDAQTGLSDARAAIAAVGAKTSP